MTYDFSFTGRSAINAAFAASGLEPNIVLTALDADVIKTYVELGMGVGIVARMAYDPVRDTAFEMLDAAHLFAPSTTRLGLRHGVFLRGFVYAFITMFAPKYDRAAIDAALENRAHAMSVPRGPRPAKARARNGNHGGWRPDRIAVDDRSVLDRPLPAGVFRHRR